ncbi:hypothetical protein PM082_009591 [Marasmius tenuissimus]|nr:hypothetical protein PM082_009591 [Marasmius tenuissimus]
MRRRILVVQYLIWAPIGSTLGQNNNLLPNLPQTVIASQAFTVTWDRSNLSRFNPNGSTSNWVRGEHQVSLAIDSARTSIVQTLTIPADSDGTHSTFTLTATATGTFLWMLDGNPALPPGRSKLVVLPRPTPTQSSRPSAFIMPSPTPTALDPGTTPATPAETPNELFPPSSTADMTVTSNDAQNVAGASSVLSSGSQASTESYLASFSPNSVAPTSQASPTPEPTERKDHKGPIIGGVVGGVLSLILLILTLLYLRRRRNPEAVTSPTEYRQNLMVVRRIETDRFYDDNEDFGYGWNEKIMGRKS